MNDNIRNLVDCLSSTFKNKHIWDSIKEECKKDSEIEKDNMKKLKQLMLLQCMIKFEQNIGR